MIDHDTLLSLLGPAYGPLIVVALSFLGFAGGTGIATLYFRLGRG